MADPVVAMPTVKRPRPAPSLPIVLTEEQAEHASRAIESGAVRDGETGCLVWTGPVNNRGCINVSLPGRRRVLLRRVAWALEHGSTPAGLMVAVSCDNRRCLEPSHLWLATPLERWRLTVARERHPNVHEKRCAKGHLLTIANTHVKEEAGRAYRRCRRCDLDRHKAMEERRRAVGVVRTRRGWRRLEGPAA